MANTLWHLSLFVIIGSPIAFLEVLYNIKTSPKNRIILLIWLVILFVLSVIGLYVSFKGMGYK